MDFKRKWNLFMASIFGADIVSAQLIDKKYPNKPIQPIKPTEEPVEFPSVDSLRQHIEKTQEQRDFKLNADYRYWCSMETKTIKEKIIRATNEGLTELQYWPRNTPEYCKEGTVLSFLKQTQSQLEQSGYTVTFVESHGELYYHLKISWAEQTK